MRIFSTFFLILAIQMFSAQSAEKISYRDLNSSNVLQFLSESSRRLNAESVNVNVQVGNDNIINVMDSKAAHLRIIQQGDYNTFNYNNADQRATNLEISTSGNNNYIDVAGNNSVSDGMKINIRGNDKMIFVRNY